MSRLPRVRRARTTRPSELMPREGRSLLQPQGSDALICVPACYLSPRERLLAKSNATTTTTTIRAGMDQYPPIPPIPNQPPSCITSPLLSGLLPRPPSPRTVRAPCQTSSCRQGCRTHRSAPHACFSTGLCRRRPCHTLDPWTSQSSPSSDPSLRAPTSKWRWRRGVSADTPPPGPLTSCASSRLRLVREPCRSSSSGTPLRPLRRPSPCDASCGPSSRVASPSSWS